MTAYVSVWLKKKLLPLLVHYVDIIFYGDLVMCMYGFWGLLFVYTCINNRVSKRKLICFVLFSMNNRCKDSIFEDTFT